VVLEFDDILETAISIGISAWTPVERTLVDAYDRGSLGETSDEKDRSNPEDLAHFGDASKPLVQSLS
jgi:hypothetical protein